jgi:hypothetical protein
VAISSPVAGQVVRGQVSIAGTSEAPGFVSSELAFSYAGDPTGTWFVLQTSGLGVTNEVLAVWDTTSISDGDYDLRLRVSLQDSTFLEASVMGLQVRNYTAPPTPTPEPTSTSTPRIEAPTAMLLAATATPTLPPPGTPTPLPPNPAALADTEIFASLERGALLIGLLFLAFGALLRLRRP